MRCTEDPSPGASEALGFANSGSQDLAAVPTLGAVSWWGAHGEDLRLRWGPGGRQVGHAEPTGGVGRGKGDPGGPWALERGMRG